MKKILSIFKNVFKIFAFIPGFIKNLLANKVMRKVVLFVGCLGFGFGIGLNLEKINLKVKDIKNKKIEFAKENKQKEKEEVKESDKGNEEQKVQEESSKEELEEKQAMESLEKINDKYKIEKARHFILKETGDKIGQLVYIGDESPARIDGDYYIFGILEDGDIGSSSKFYVDKETFKVYEDSIKDKYFGEYRGI